MSEPFIIVEDIHKSYLMGKEAVPRCCGGFRCRFTRVILFV